MIKRTISTCRTVWHWLRCLVLTLRARWQCFRTGHSLKWVRNIYGDEIVFASNGNRSEWKCTHCGIYHFRPELHRENADKA